LTTGARAGVEVKPGQPLQRRQVENLLNRLAGEAEGSELLDGLRLHPHGLWHSYALELRRRRVAIDTIQKALGHASLDCTALYLSTIAAGRAGEEIDAVGRDSLSAPAHEAMGGVGAADPLIPAARRVLLTRGPPKLRRPGESNSWSAISSGDFSSSPLQGRAGRSPTRRRSRPGQR
jgi:hypothetical protein